MTTFSDPFGDWWGTDNPFADGPVGQTRQNRPPAAFDFTDFLESEPEIPYQGAVRRANLTPNQLQTFRNQRDNIFKQFQAQLDEQFRQGMLPTGTATDFFRNYDFEREFQRLPPSQRLGGDTQRFNPRIRVFRDRSGL